MSEHATDQGNGDQPQISDQAYAGFELLSDETGQVEVAAIEQAAGNGEAYA